MEEIQGYPCPHCGFDPRSVRGIEYALPMGTILAGKYLVGRVLGQGGFGITYVGWDIALERKVAIKEYYPSGQVSRNPGSRGLTWYTSVQSQQAKQNGTQIFLKEARKMSKVDDIPNVVRVRDLFQENETAYIVMDFVEGETLKARLDKTGPLTWKQAKEIFVPAIQAMEQVHQAGLVHRDISPDNLMLTPDGKVKILDLGAAKDLSVNNGASSMQVAKGGFSPFEQYTQRGSSGPWTDVYAMAATVYFTLTGKLPPVATDRVVEDTISWEEPGLKALSAQALEALQKAQCMDIIEKFPNGVNTVIGSQGIYLSGGETQRIVIARAILKNAPVVILDEATAFADPDNETKVQIAFNELAKRRTVIMIAHRLSTIVNADTIFVLKEGHIVESGSFAELSGQKGSLFGAMWRDYQQSVQWKMAKEG